MLCDAGNLSWLKSSCVGVDKKPALTAVHTDTAGAGGSGSGGGGTDGGTNGSDGVVMVNGALVNISSVLHNLTKSEEERTQTETELKDKEQECGLYHSRRLCFFSGFKILPSKYQIKYVY